MSLSISITSSLGGLLSPRMKRLVFLSSLVAQIKDEAFPMEKSTKKANELLHLSGDHTSLFFPFQLCSVIWRGKTKKEIIGGDVDLDDFGPARIAEVSSTVVENAPSWLHYGDDPLIKQDVQTILQNRTEVLGYHH